MRQYYMYLLCQTTSKHFKYTLYHIKNTLSFNIWFEKEKKSWKAASRKLPHPSICMLHHLNTSGGKFTHGEIIKTNTSTGNR